MGSDTHQSLLDEFYRKIDRENAAEDLPESFSTEEELLDWAKAWGATCMRLRHYNGVCVTFYRFYWDELYEGDCVYYAPNYENTAFVIGSYAKLNKGHSRHYKLQFAPCPWTR